MQHSTPASLPRAPVASQHVLVSPRSDPSLAEPALARTMILCAGFGSRMTPLTETLPKPLLPVGDASTLSHICTELQRLGEAVAVANSHWRGQEIVNLSDKLPITLKVSSEETILGVAGGVHAARHLLQGPAVIWNGDIWISEPPLVDLRSTASRNGNIGLAVAQPISGGTVGLNAAGQVVRLRGERFGEETSCADYIGLCALTEVALTALPPQGCLIGDYCLPRLRKGLPIDTLLVETPWLDVGSFDGYLRANLDWLNRRGSLETGYVHSTATVTSAVNPARSIVGAGARVEGNGDLSECVVWPGALANAPLKRCIVTPTHRICLDDNASPAR